MATGTSSGPRRTTRTAASSPKGSLEHVLSSGRDRTLSVRSRPFSFRRPLARPQESRRTDGWRGRASRFGSGDRVTFQAA